MSAGKSGSVAAAQIMPSTASESILECGPT
jgi:hypothetical protein